jgi:mannose-1-phosphate guanylyltransferase
MNSIYLLVGGEATRLFPLSKDIPKALLTVRGKKIIDIILENFLSFGDFDFNLICAYKHKEIWEIYKSKSKLPINLHFEKEKLDTAGYIVKNLDGMPESFFCMNGDLLLDINLSDFINNSLISKTSLIGSIEVDDPSRYGVIQVDEYSRVIKFVEKPKTNSFGRKISIGLYHLFKRDINEIKNGLEIPCSFEKDVFPKLAENSLLNTFTVNGEMVDVGTHESYISAHLYEGDTNWISSNNTSISENVKLSNSVILDSCIIENDVVINNSIICPNSIIKKGSRIDGKIIRNT